LLNYCLTFLGSETTEKMTLLMNDVFDIMNGRFIAAGINRKNWEKKKKVLDVFLKVLEDTEAIYEEENKGSRMNMFMSTTTLRSWRVTTLSTIALAEEMLSYDEDYFTVLTGKLNQDPIEV
jgi:hypothetical protein